MAVAEDWEIEKLDVKTEFLYSGIEAVIYVK
jgi:hypothetical protein